MPFLIISFFEKVQVSPELYGDTRPRFFIYWTVKQKKKMWFGLFRYCISICYNLVNFRMADWCLPTNRVLQSLMLRVCTNEQWDCDGGCHLTLVFIRLLPIWYQNPHMEGLISIHSFQPPTVHWSSLGLLTIRAPSKSTTKSHFKQKQLHKKWCINCFMCSSRLLLYGHS